MDWNMIILKAFRRIRLAKGLAQAELGRRSGIDRSTIAKIETVDTYNITLTTLQRICEGLGITLKDLAEEIEREISPVKAIQEIKDPNRKILEAIYQAVKDVPEKEESVQSYLIALNNRFEDILKTLKKKVKGKEDDGKVVSFQQYVPYYMLPRTINLNLVESRIGAGKASVEYDVIGKIEVESKGKPDHAVRVKGTSMEPEIPDGSLIFVRSDGFLWHNGDVVVAFLPDSNEWTVKRIFVEDQGAKVILMGTNGWNETFKAEQVIVQGVVEDVVKDLDEVDRIVKSVKEIEDMYFD